MNEVTEVDFVARLRKLCRDLPEMTEKTSYGHPAFTTKRGIFAVMETYGGELSLCVKVGFDRQQLLLTDPRFYLTPYIGKRGWVSLKLRAAPLDWGEIGELVADSHALVNRSRKCETFYPDIDHLYTAWGDAFRRQDIEAILALLTPDYVLWAAGAPPMGADALRPLLLGAFADFEIAPSFDCEERLVSGDLAFDRGWDIQQLRPRSGGDAQLRRQRVFLLLRRCADGAWRFARGMSQPGPED